ncbi:MIZU-KUSSEI 1 protein [Nymphaea thermarum]|nr:MIZU-KUSSEI 1 protein [Nymphaea thermarum]
MTLEPHHLRRNSSSRKIIPATTAAAADSDDLTIPPPPSSFKRFSSSKQLSKPHKLASLIRSLSTTLLPFKTFLPSCRWSKFPSSSSSFSLPSSRRVPVLGKKVTGTLFGHRRGHVNFVVQDQPGSDPALLLELAMPTSSLVKEMASGLVRLALECERAAGKPLFGEPFWTMYCNGRKTGYAMSRECGESDQKVLGLLRAVSVGAGVLPLAQEGGELMYMRARFERVVGSSDSEAFYMMNPDGNGGPELSIFLIRI